LIKESINNIELLLNEKNGKVELLFDAKNDLIMADEIHFGNLLNNLFDNALKYSKENLLIKVSTINGGDKVKIKIEDNGIGMTKETLSKIFEKFYRAHTGNIHDVKGFGLGLSYVKTMVEAHGGTIKAESSFGKGTSFLITLPLSK
jgi:two-component system phosphate regulon sensor histidine kinase PhoR